MVRKILFLSAFVSTSILGFSQPLFSYGKKQVTKAEFLKAYNKNPSLEETDRKKALQEYLQLYINYKLNLV
ncbi:MAG: hypothetical protein MUE72_07660, partial [Chitinophagaceae bacterium]|nr:hypothetical protein [Chitinophagaceae bacterium]